MVNDSPLHFIDYILRKLQEGNPLEYMKMSSPSMSEFNNDLNGLLTALKKLQSEDTIDSEIKDIVMALQRIIDNENINFNTEVIKKKIQEHRTQQNIQYQNFISKILELIRRNKSEFVQNETVEFLISLRRILYNDLIHFHEDEEIVKSLIGRLSR